MFQRYHRILPIIFILIILTTCCSGCASSTKPTVQTGRVTDATVTDTIVTSGSVSAKQIAALTWGTKGVIQKINVDSQDQVVSGEELMKLDLTSTSSEVLEAVSTLVKAKQNLENVQSSSTSLATAEVALVNAKSAYQEALEQYYTLDVPVGSAEYIDILKKEYLSAQQNLTRAYTQYNSKADLAEDEPERASAYANLAQARINLQDAFTRLNHFSNPPTASQAEIINANLEIAKANLTKAQRNYDEIMEGNTAALTQAQAAVDAAQTTVNRLSIIAPFDGEVAVVYSQIGDVVSENSKALVLVDRSSLYMEVLVDESSIKQVKIGNPATISFSALGIETTGKVEWIDPIGITSGNVVNFTVRIQLDESNPDVLIGSTATVVITTGEPHQNLYVPVSAVLTDEEGEYVTRVTDSGATERISVVTNNITDEKVEVTGDLKSGEAVLLYTTAASDDTDTDQNGRGGLMGLGGFFR